VMISRKSFTWQRAQWCREIVLYSDSPIANITDTTILFSRHHSCVCCVEPFYGYQRRADDFHRGVCRRKFSVRAFSADLVKYECRALQYIGELCRYLCNAPANPDDDKVRIDYAIGNGMRPDVWEKFQVRTLWSHVWWWLWLLKAV
jgi:hypothetical protein